MFFCGEFGVMMGYTWHYPLQSRILQLLVLLDTRKFRWPNRGGQMQQHLSFTVLMWFHLSDRLVNLEIYNPQVVK